MAAEDWLGDLGSVLERAHRARAYATKAIQRAKDLSSLLHNDPKDLSAPAPGEDHAATHGEGPSSSSREETSSSSGPVLLPVPSEHTAAALPTVAPAGEPGLSIEVPRACLDPAAPLPTAAQDADCSQSQHEEHEEPQAAQVAQDSASLQPELEPTDPNTGQPLLEVARRLAALQFQQASTLASLLSLRQEQLRTVCRLRIQQLCALSDLLRAESADLEGTPLQVSAIQQALSLLDQSMRDMQIATDGISASALSGHLAGSAAASVSSADARAEDISRMARQLLGVLREFPRRRAAASTADGLSPGREGGGGVGEAAGGRTVVRSIIRGATAYELARLPSIICTTSHPLVLSGEACAICLAAISPGDTLKAMPCSHQMHEPCLDQWLRIKACCPLCKVALPGTKANVTLTARGDHVATTETGVTAVVRASEQQSQHDVLLAGSGAHSTAAEHAQAATQPLERLGEQVSQQQVIGNSSRDMVQVATGSSTDVSHAALAAVGVEIAVEEDVLWAESDWLQGPQPVGVLSMMSQSQPHQEASPLPGGVDAHQEESHEGVGSAVEGSAMASDGYNS